MSKGSVDRTGCALVLGLVLLATPALAQESWSLSGRVVDGSTETPIPAARVHWVEEDRDFLANDEGRFLVLDIHHHRITLLVEALGYESAVWEISADMVGALVDIPLTNEALRLEGIDVGVRQSVWTFVSLNRRRG